MSALGRKYSSYKRPLIFLGVLFLHGAVVSPLLRASHVLHSPNRNGNEPLVFLLLHPEAVFNSPAASTASAPAVTAPRRKKLAPRAEESNTITAPAEGPATPTINWEHEAELAAQKQLSAMDKERDYRNLAGLSAAQLKFVRDNHWVPMAPGIVWAHPRVEIDKKTLIPIIHINDHCVLIFLFPFCAIGHIHPNDHLFDPLHDAPAP
jgi:hypothetical protein